MAKVQRHEVQSSEVGERRRAETRRAQPPGISLRAILADLMAEAKMPTRPLRRRFAAMSDAV